MQEPLKPLQRNERKKRARRERRRGQGRRGQGGKGLGRKEKGTITLDNEEKRASESIPYKVP